MLPDARWVRHSSPRHSTQKPDLQPPAGWGRADRSTDQREDPDVAGSTTLNQQTGPEAGETLVVQQVDYSHVDHVTDVDQLEPLPRLLHFRHTRQTRGRHALRGPFGQMLMEEMAKSDLSKSDISKQVQTR